jgi:hypothetical protein
MSLMQIHIYILVNDSGAWTNKSLTYLENLGVVVLKAKHSTKEIQHRAEGLLTKLLLLSNV